MGTGSIRVVIVEMTRISIHKRFVISIAMILVMQCEFAVRCVAEQPGSAAAAGALAEDVLVIENLIVSAIDSAAVPSTIAGTIRDLVVREGDSVSKGQPLAQLDDAEARSAYMQAAAEAKIAVELAASQVASELADQDLMLANQAIDRQVMSVEIAEKKAASDIRVRAAEKASLVAKNEMDHAAAARDRFSDSVSQSEIDGLTLAHQRSLLEAQQAELERQLDSLTAQIERQSALELKTAVRAAELEVSKSRFDQSILRLRADSIRHQVDQAKLVVMKHRIASPLDGVVAEVFRRPGEWMQPGDAIFRIVRLSRLRAEGFLSSDQAMRLRSAANDKSKKSVVTLDWAMSKGERKSIAGEVSFISPEVDAINNQVRFWVEFDNPDALIFPGMKVNVRIVSHSDPEKP